MGEVAQIKERFPKAGVETPALGGIFCSFYDRDDRKSRFVIFFCELEPLFDGQQAGKIRLKPLPNKAC